VIAPSLVGELVDVDLLVDAAVYLFDTDVADLHDAERRSEVLADDARVVLLAPLPRRALLDPVVTEVAEGLRGRRGVSDASLRSGTRLSSCAGM
jgi:hypothetical protein